jgi:hypothetical protein
MGNDQCSSTDHSIEHDVNKHPSTSESHQQNNY